MTEVSRVTMLKKGLQKDKKNRMQTFPHPVDNISNITEKYIK